MRCRHVTARRYARRDKQKERTAAVVKAMAAPPPRSRTSARECRASEAAPEQQTVKSSCCETHTNNISTQRSKLALVDRQRAHGGCAGRRYNVRILSYHRNVASAHAKLPPRSEWTGHMHVWGN